MRAYDPSIGRFLSEDPLPSVNPYPYVVNDPVNLLDASGAGAFGEFVKLVVAIVRVVLPFFGAYNSYNSYTQRNYCKAFLYGLGSFVGFAGLAWGGMVEATAVDKLAFGASGGMIAGGRLGFCNWAEHAN